ncbi:MAG: hypothetical protein Q7J16_07600 [Candidatus Cloacimonadales bacterium]|nr:hypothetical protein [Candidatus Cloacimonadales bacterium]
MSRSFKNFLKLAFVSGLSYLGYKIFRLIKDAIELEKFLPRYFESHLGEKPEINLAITFNQTTLTAKFSKETLEKNPDLEQSILDYVNNYYSSFCLKKFKVVLLEKVEEKDAKEESIEKTESPLEEPVLETIQVPEETIETVKVPSQKRVRKPIKKKT